MSCADVEPLLPLVADEALRPADDPHLFAHLAACPHCQEALRRHDLITVALERTAAPAVTPTPHRRPISWWWGAAPLAAAAAMAVVIALPTSAPAPAPLTTVAQAAPVAAPVVAAPVPDSLATPASLPVIDRDVAAVPGPVPGKRLILVRRGDQVLLVDPHAPVAPTRDDVAPASLRY